MQSDVREGSSLCSPHHALAEYHHTETSEGIQGSISTIPWEKGAREREDPRQSASAEAEGGACATSTTVRTHQQPLRVIRCYL